LACSLAAALFPSVMNESFNAPLREVFRNRESVVISPNTFPQRVGASDG
jgi:hypothetical protein